MGQLYYNRLKNTRIKKTLLGTIAILASALFNLMTNMVGREDITLYHVLVFYLIVVGVTYLIGLIPFGQVVESLENKTFSTYYKLGRLRFKERTWDKADKVSIEQDHKRFYCIVIKTVNGQSLQVERYPVLNQAEEELSEFKKLFD